jgi:methionyl-tRNA formyltransferase
VRVAYLGTSAFAAGVLERLAHSAHRPVLVVTRPDRPAGRGRKLSAPPVADAALALGLGLDQPESVNGGRGAGRRSRPPRPTSSWSARSARSIKEPLLSDFPILNVHPSLLPRWRGAAPRGARDHGRRRGDRRLHHAPDAGLDSGPVCLRGTEPIAPDDTFGTLAPRLEQLGADLLSRPRRRARGLGAGRSSPRRADLRGEDRARGPHAGPRRLPSRAGAGRPRAVPAHRGPAAPGRRELPRGPARPGGGRIEHWSSWRCFHRGEGR